jgi:hypothetical protein
MLMAPESEVVLTIFGAMNAFNGDDDTTGDHWSSTEFIVQVPESDLGLIQTVGLGTLALLAARRRSPRSA